MFQIKAALESSFAPHIFFVKSFELPNDTGKSIKSKIMDSQKVFFKIGNKLQEIVRTRGNDLFNTVL